MKTFQKPLTAAEERLCLRRCQEGDPEAKRILIERNLRLVAHVAKKYQGNGEELEDLISIGTIGLIKAISTFNSERSARLSTYAARCIDNELLMMLRARKKCSREVSLYEPIGTDKEGNEISLLDIYQAVECLGSTGQLFGFHDNPNPACPIGHNIHNVLDGKLEDIQTAMEKEMSQTTLKDVVEDTQKRMKLESVS